MFDRRLLESFDWGLFLLIFTIASMGLVILYSALTTGSEQILHPLFKRQMSWMAFGIIVMVIAFLLDYKYFDEASIVIYLFCIGLLITVFISGKYAGGSQRWLAVGPFTMQPSEIMKIALIIILASVYSDIVSEKGLDFKKLFKPVLVSLVPFLLIANQPDLGTAMLLFLIAGSITLFVKVEKRVLIYCTALCVSAIPLCWFFLLKEYQISRILTLFNPGRDPLGAGYHIIQSKIAIGSGMLTGKGFLQGTQNTLAFLPEQHTDFIVSVLAEEWGFIGCFFLLFLYFILLLWGLNISYGCRNMFGSILAFGITSMIFWQIFINFGMVMGLMPVVGVPLPLVSYGGSSVITNMIGFGILLNISMRKYISN
ncbi:MAG: rod shape-determining protein RodA [Desulfobacteraceae bacterium]|nr:rod shape-determining protein RodA [Desulfobacteraceae bacterium]